MAGPFGRNTSIYGFVFYAWGVRRELPMQELKSYSSFKDRMLEPRPSAS